MTEERRVVPLDVVEELVSGWHDELHTGKGNVGLCPNHLCQWSVRRLKDSSFPYQDPEATDYANHYMARFNSLRTRVEELRDELRSRADGIWKDDAVARALTLDEADRLDRILEGE